MARKKKTQQQLVQKSKGELLAEQFINQLNEAQAKERAEREQIKVRKAVAVIHNVQLNNNLNQIDNEIRKTQLKVEANPNLIKDLENTPPETLEQHDARLRAMTIKPEEAFKTKVIEGEQAAKTISVKKPSMLQRVTGFFKPRTEIIEGTHRKSFMDNLTRRGPSVGASYEARRGIQKFRYSKGKQIGLTPSFSRYLKQKGYDLDKMTKTEKRRLYSSFDFKYDQKSGKWKYRQKEVKTPAFVKRGFSELAKGFQPREKQSVFEKQRAAFYQQQQQLYGSGNFDLHNHPFTEAAVQSNKNREEYFKTLQNSRTAWLIGQAQHDQRLALGKKIVQQQSQNMNETNQLRAFNMFSSENQKNNQAIDLFQNSVCNPNDPNSINILTQRPDSLNLLSTGRPNVLQTNPANDILHAPNFMKGELRKS